MQNHQVVMKTISIITVTFNASATLQKTLQSITSQTVFEDQVEFIVIDGASRDNTLEMIEPFRPVITQLVSEPDRGIFDAMNKGIQLSSTPWILFMNAGDQFYDERTLESLHLESKVPDHILYGDCIRVLNNGSHELRLASPFFKHPDRICGIGICHQSTYVPRKMLVQHPFFWDQYPHCADFKFLYDRWKDGVRFQYIPQPLCLYAYGDGFSSDNRHHRLILDENARIVHRRHSLAYYRERLRIIFDRLLSRP